MAEKKRFKVEQKDGKAFVDDKDLGLQIEEYRSLSMKMTAMKRHRHITRYDQTAVDEIRISGTANLEGPLHVAGIGVSTSKVGLSISTISEADAERLDWHASYGYLAADWETRSGEFWYVEIRVPQSVWAAFEAEYVAGRVREVSVSVKGGLWAPWSPMPALERGGFTLLPDQNGGSGGGFGKVSYFGWGDAPLLRPWEDDDEEFDESATVATAITKAPDSPLASIMTAGTQASEKLAKTWAWCMPAIVILLAIMAARM